MSTALNRQEKDAGVIATAANQVQLSRQITESARELEVGKGAESAGDLKEALNQLTRAHVDLLFGDEFEGIPGDLSPEMTELYNSLEPHYAAIVGRASGLLASFETFNPFTETPIEGVHWAKRSNFDQPENEDDFQQVRTFRLSVGFRF